MMMLVGLKYHLLNSLHRTDHLLKKTTEHNLQLMLNLQHKHNLLQQFLLQANHQQMQPNKLDMLHFQQQLKMGTFVDGLIGILS